MQLIPWGRSKLGVKNVGSRQEENASSLFTAMREPRDGEKDGCVVYVHTMSAVQ